MNALYLALRRRHTSERGQGLVEFAMVVPLFMLLLLGLLEFGFVFDHAMTLNYATREGARSGAAFAAGNATTMPCATSTDVDKHVMAAIQRVLEAPGSPIVLSRIDDIRIYKATSSGSVSGGQENVWEYNPGGGPSVDGANLDFSQTSQGWNACTRDNSWSGGAPPDSIGVSVRYQYQYVTPLAAAMQFFGSVAGGGSLEIADRSIMALNPTD
ncbi:MAG TPA: TadE/TadG family type IV pilus assembly protein [Candidatus Limnocylindrales bacterium]